MCLYETICVFYIGTICNEQYTRDSLTWVNPHFTGRFEILVKTIRIVAETARAQ